MLKRFSFLLTLQLYKLQQRKRVCTDADRTSGRSRCAASPEQKGDHAPGERAMSSVLLGDSGEGGDGDINSLKNQFALPTD